MKALQIKSPAGVWETVTKKAVQRDDEYLSTADYMAGKNDEESWNCPLENKGTWWRMIELEEKKL